MLTYPDRQAMIGATTLWVVMAVRGCGRLRAAKISIFTILYDGVDTSKRRRQHQWP